MEYRFRNLAAATAVLTGFLMLLGVFTAAEGAGLTCAQRWPLCDGPLGGLLPANYLSGVEWFHRVVAAVTGLVILGQTVQAWRTGQSAGVRYASTLALVVLPVQVVLGMFTVTTYEWLVLVAHFATATLIFAAVVYAAARAYAGSMERTAVRARTATLVGAGLAPLAAVVSPRLVFEFGSAVQVAYYALLLTLFAALLSATVWLRAERTRAVTGLATLVVAGLLVLGRQNYGRTVALGTVVALGLVLVCSLVASRWAKAEIAVKRSTGIFADSDD
ncbi:COX15/CtaA family protein [Halorarius halobius]|uniref:COX15/CtaA family protein n=1 Tax=Halorarius halobius TaxID=2962671 RepID=UPI0020CBE74F|nr:COX15/CtaA family protein [Halorarius halobius]